MKNNRAIFIEKMKKRHKSTVNILMIVGIMALITFIVYITGGAMYANLQFMYIPIVLTAYYYGVSGTLLVSVICGLLVGPLMPLNTAESVMQSSENWVIRLLIFVGVGLFTSLTIHFMKKEHQKTEIILEEINDGICGVDVFGNITFVNRKICDILQIENPQNLIGLNIINKIFVGEKDHRIKNIEDTLKNSEQLKDFTCAIQNAKEEYITVDCSIYPVKYSKKRSDFIITVSVNLERLEYQRKLIQLSYSDELTNTKNRRYFDSEFDKFNNKTENPLSLVLCDVDGTKFVNDTFGHKTGDYLIQKTAEILQSNLNELGFVSRLDGDEFAVLLYTIDSVIVDKYIETIKEAFNTFFINDLKMSISCGYEIRDTDMSVNEIFINAENDMYLEKNSSANKLRVNAVDTIMKTLHEKDEYSEQHSIGVSNVSTKLASFCGFPQKQLAQITNAALLHDIGKIVVPIDIICKKGRLTEEEYSKIKEHSAIGSRLLSGMPEFSNIADIVLNHHENWDGSGYPQNIKGEDIRIESRIISIADAFNAMTTARPYNKVRTNREALEEVIRCSGTQFDPALVEIFSKHFEEIVK